MKPFDNDSAANAYHARLIVRGEPLYSTHHPLHHMPAVYYTYALAFLFLGDSTWSVKVLLIPWTIATAIIIFLIGNRYAGKWTGFWGAIFYALLNSHMLLKGTTAEIELFANLPIALAIYLGLELTLRKSRSWTFLIPGVVSGVAFLYKAVFISPLLIVTLIIILSARLNIKSQNTKHFTVRSLLCFWVGFVTPLIILVSIYAANGLLTRFLLVFTLGGKYINVLTTQTSILLNLILPLSIIGINNLILLLLCLHGIIRFIRQTKNKQITYSTTIITGTAIIFWFLISVVIAGITRKGFLHYSLIIVPPLAIIASWEMIKLSVKINLRNKDLLSPKKYFPIALIIAMILFVSGFTNSQLFHHFILNKLGKESYQNSLIKGSQLSNSKPTKIQLLSDYVIENTSKEDRIYYWSDNVQLYYLTDRRSPIDNIWPLYAEATGSYKLIFSPKTKIIIVGESTQISQPDWLNEELDKYYRLVKIIDGDKVYQRTE